MKKHLLRDLFFLGMLAAMYVSAVLLDSAAEVIRRPEMFENVGMAFVIVLLILIVWISFFLLFGQKLKSFICSEKKDTRK